MAASRRGGKRGASVRRRRHRSGDAQAVVELHAELYGRERGYDDSFRAFVEDSVNGLVGRDDPREALWIVESGDRHLGSICLKKADESTAQLGLFLLHPDARGTGQGRRLLEEALRFGVEQGYRSVMLWTNSELVQARSLYASFGFERVEERVAFLSGREMTEERWERSLEAPIGGDSAFKPTASPDPSPAADPAAETVMDPAAETFIYLIRHAESAYRHGEERSRGLTDAGRAEARRVADRLRSRPIRAVYSSPYERALQTVRPLAETLGIGVVELEPLRERAMADESAALSWAEVQEAMRRSFEQPELALPGGESLREAQRSVAATAASLLRAHPGESIALGTHGRIMAALLAHYDPSFGFDAWQSLSMPDVYRLTFRDGSFAGMERIWSDGEGEPEPRR